MKTSHLPLRSVLASLVLALAAPAAQASIAYGSINNFDTVNDTGSECHGFEIEIEDCRSRDITYTFSWNHYGVPKLTEHLQDPLHPKVCIRWESGKKPDGSWAAYTAIPSGPISPTNGHMFTNPSINFGGEHFGVGYSVAVGLVKYFWLLDDGAGNLVRGPKVDVATPVFNYYPPIGQAPAQVLAEIQPPPEPVHVKEFGDALWVKEIRTTSHNKGEVKLRDLLSDDPDHADEKNWKNGERDEVESEWELLQTEFNAADGGKKGKLAAAPEDLPDGDEVVTRRYEFYKYTGPLDTETGEAVTDTVAPDHVHGVGTATANGIEYNLAELEVVGEFTGAQMAAVDVDAKLGLIDHLQEGELNAPYPERRVVVAGNAPFTTVTTGDLPAGMSFDGVTGILSGTPDVTGEFQFKVSASDGVGSDVVKSYTLSIVEAGAALVARSLVDTLASPVEGGTTEGDGAFAAGAEASATAVPAAGYQFVNWTDNGQVVSQSASYTLTMEINHSLTAHFAQLNVQRVITAAALPMAGGTITGAGTVADGAAVTLTAVAQPGYGFVNWTENGAAVSSSPTLTFNAAADRSLEAHFVSVISWQITTAVLPVAAGTVTGGGSRADGSQVTLTAVPANGFAFVNWTESGLAVAQSPGYTFTATVARSLVANFAPSDGLRVISTGSSPAAGGTTTGGGAFPDGREVTVTAVPNPGYMFKRWLEGASNRSSSPSYTFTVSAPSDLTARFAPAATITTSAQPALAGTTSGGGLFEDGDNVTVIATPAAGATFANWTEGGTIVSTSGSFTFKPRPDTAPVRKLVANFNVPLRTITVSADPAAGGTITGAGVWANGTAVLLTATAQPDYVFTGWTEDAGVISTSRTLAFTATANRSLTAHFVPAFTISVSAGPAAGGIVTGSGPAPAGSSWTCSARARDGYSFVNWTTPAGVEVSRDDSYEFTATTHRSLVAHFAIEALGLVENGGFETGDFTGWTLETPGTNFSGVFAGPAASGIQAAALGTPSHGALEHHLRQTPRTRPGKRYLLSFSLKAANSLSNVLRVSCGGHELGVFNNGDPRFGNGPVHAPVNISLPFTAEAPARDLKFSYLESGLYWVLDDVRVEEEPALDFVISPDGPLRVCWPAASTGWILQESAGLGAVDWVDSVRDVMEANGMHEVTLPNPAIRGFFRLVHP